MDSEVAKTLAELERKLQELERALGTASRERPQETPAYEPTPGPGAMGTFAGSGARLVDERLESASPAAVPPQGRSEHQDLGAPAPEQPPHGFEDSIDLVELARFRDRIEQTMRELLLDYERVIRLRSIYEGQAPPQKT